MVLAVPLSRLKYGGFHPIVTEVVPVGGGADENAEFISINRTSRQPWIA